MFSPVTLPSSSSCWFSMGSGSSETKLLFIMGMNRLLQLLSGSFRMLRIGLSLISYDLPWIAFFLSGLIRLFVPLMMMASCPLSSVSVYGKICALFVPLNIVIMGPFVWVLA